MPIPTAEDLIRLSRELLSIAQRRVRAGSLAATGPSLDAGRSVITGQIRCAPEARDAQHELRALGDMSLMLSSEAREVCILAQEARWLPRQARAGPPATCAGRRLASPPAQASRLADEPNQQDGGVRRHQHERTALMSDLTPEMQRAMGAALLGARRHLIANFPKQGEQLLRTALVMGFTELMIHAQPAAQRALADATNDRLAGTRWRITEQAN